MTSITQNLHALGLVSTRARTRTLLDPALVEAALARLDQELTRDEQEIVLRGIGDRSKVNWPHWWQVR